MRSWLTDGDWIYYSTCDEDAESELTALAITSTDSVVTVTGSGCRALSLLAQQPASLLCVDLAPGQTHLLELKLAAIRTFDYDTLLRFLGVEPCRNRSALFAELRPHVSTLAHDFFARRPWAIEEGVILTGKHEQVYRRILAPWMRLRHHRSLRRMLNASTLTEQEAIYAQNIDRVDWRTLIRWGTSERALRFLFRQAGYAITVDVDDPGDYVLRRLDRCLRTRLLRDNDWVSFMLLGRYPDRHTLPHYLRRGSYEAIRSAPTEVSLHSGDLIGVLAELPAGSIDKFSLSDVTSCITRQTFAELMDAVAHAANPNSVICYRNFLAKYHPGAESPLRRDGALSERLTAQDRAFIYDIEVLRHAPAPAAAATEQP